MAMAEEIRNAKSAGKPNGDDKAKNARSTDKPASPAKEKVKFSVKFKKFIKDYKSEIRKIVWPTREQVMKNTGIVVFVIVVIAAFVGVLDLLFGLGIKGLANL